jgi:uncharacterized protein (DUF2236 family)
MAVDGGYFPRGTSVLRRVHEERAVGLFYGQRALCIGALAPLNYVGTSEHTANKTRPFRRLAHTAGAFEAVMFGSRAEADAVLAQVHRMHLRVRGELPQDAGPFKAGTHYDALEPELMLWTLAVLMDSAECFFDLLVRRLSAPEREALWAEYIQFGELFGMPREVAPATHAEFREYYDGVLAGDGLWLTEEARYMGRASAFEIPLPASHQAAKRMHDLIMLGSLPARVRDLYGLAWSPAHALAFRAAVEAARAARPLLPGWILRGSNRASFELVQSTEARRIEAGRRTPRVPVRPAAAR